MPSTLKAIFDDLHLQNIPLELEIRSLSSSFLRAVYIVCLQLPDDMIDLQNEEDTILYNHAKTFINEKFPRILMPEIVEHIFLTLAQRNFK